MTVKICLDPMSMNFIGMDCEPETGREYVVVEKYNIRTGLRTWTFRSDTSSGVPGNMNPSIRKYHGWRGTTNDISRYAYGVRRVEKIVHQKNGWTRITLSDDLAPELD